MNHPNEPNTDSDDAPRWRVSEPNRALLLGSLSVIPLLVWWLGWFPGFLSTDSIDQLEQAARFDFFNFHPISHTFSLWAVTRVWDHPGAVTMVQLLVLAGLLGYIAKRLTEVAGWPGIAIGLCGGRRWPYQRTEHPSALCLLSLRVRGNAGSDPDNPDRSKIGRMASPVARNIDTRGATRRVRQYRTGSRTPCRGGWRRRWRRGCCGWRPRRRCGTGDSGRPGWRPGPAARRR